MKETSPEKAYLVGPREREKLGLIGQPVRHRDSELVAIEPERRSDQLDVSTTMFRGSGCALPLCRRVSFEEVDDIPLGLDANDLVGTHGPYEMELARPVAVRAAPGEAAVFVPIRARQDELLNQRLQNRVRGLFVKLNVQLRPEVVGEILELSAGSDGHQQGGGLLVDSDLGQGDGVR